jgi:preprotein translocase subunit SecG
MLAFLDGLLKALHVFMCLVLIFVVLLQQGRGGGMGAAFGGGQAAQVFGGSGAGNILTRATAICATIFMLTSVGLAYRSSSGDRALATRLELEKMKRDARGSKRQKNPDQPVPSASGAPAPAGSAAP